jgi:hypothetical protein
VAQVRDARIAPHADADTVSDADTVTDPIADADRYADTGPDAVAGPNAETDAEAAPHHLQTTAPNTAADADAEAQTETHTHTAGDTRADIDRDAAGLASLGPRAGCYIRMLGIPLVSM